MGKVRKTKWSDQIPVSKSTQPSQKKRRKRKGNKESLNSVQNKNISKKSNKTTKNTLQNEYKKRSEKRKEHDYVKVANQKKMEQIPSKRKMRQKKSEKPLKLNGHKIKIKRLEEMLTDKVQTKQTEQKMKNEQSLTLRDRMMAHLKASRFRFINETLYNNESSQSKHYFKEDPDAFKAYHDGYKQQLEQWPIKPLDIIISSIKKMPTDNVIADFGCGEAQLAASVPHKVHSFDFIALNDRVKACDMAHTPLLTNSVDAVVFCLSLMGTNLTDYLVEANRVLKNNGILKIAEVESRFENVENFLKTVSRYGFRNTWKNLSHDLFYFMDFKKEEEISGKKKNLPSITLKPCLYKKR